MVLPKCYLVCSGQPFEGFPLGFVFRPFCVVLRASLRSKRGVFCGEVKCGLRVCELKKVLGLGYFEEEKWDISS